MVLFKKTIAQIVRFRGEPYQRGDRETRVNEVVSCVVNEKWYQESLRWRHPGRCCRFLSSPEERERERERERNAREIQRGDPRRKTETKREKGETAESDGPGDKKRKRARARKRKTETKRGREGGGRKKGCLEDS